MLADDSGACLSASWTVLCIKLPRKTVRGVDEVMKSVARSGEVVVVVMDVSKCSSRSNRYFSTYMYVNSGVCLAKRMRRERRMIVQRERR